MSANAPYYQNRAGQVIEKPDTSTSQSHLTDEESYDMTGPVVMSPPEPHSGPVFAGHPSHATSMDTQLSTVEENRNLAELLEAATTAAGQAAQAMDARDVDITDSAAQAGKRKRVSSSPEDDMPMSPQEDEHPTAKRQRVETTTDHQVQHAQQVMLSPQNTRVPSTESLLMEARAAGVHSAAALFRRSSERSSRSKYTRPPMSKLFISLQLSPENFLLLQAAAKAYMLDANFPERQNCVGNRGKGDSDMVKLRLFNCVRSFLDAGAGEQYFGEHVDKPGQRETIQAARALGEEQAPNSEEKIMWPRDGNKIIGLVTPLMRRMVTNERQRMYAIETRKGGAKKKENSAEAMGEQITSPPPHGRRDQSVEQQLLQSPYDPKLGQTPVVQPMPNTSIRSTHDTSSDTALSHRNGTVHYETAESTDLPLPTSAPTNFHLSHINIFLVLAPNDNNSNHKPSITLLEKRISAEKPDHLAFYPWNDFLLHMIGLLKGAKARYPQIREGLALQDRPTSPPALPENTESVGEDLRGLAAAANALQGQNVSSSAGESANQSGESQTTQPQESSISKDTCPPNTAADTTNSTAPMKHAPIPTPQPHLTLLDQNDSDAALPRYIIKTIGPDGWEYIEHASQWYQMLLRRAYEPWADGVVNVIVELVDVPVGGERVMSTQAIAVGGKEDEKDG